MNSWIVQATPQQFLIDWYLDEYVKSHPNDKDWWLIEKRYQNVIQPEDVIYVWKAKSEPPHKIAEDYFKWQKNIGRTRQVAGIFAVGRVLTFPKRWPPPPEYDERFKKYRIGNPWEKLTIEDYWVLCTYTNNLAINPLLQETIWGKLGQPPETDLGWFKQVRRRRLVKLETWEADVIDSLISK